MSRQVRDTRNEHAGEEKGSDGQRTGSWMSQNQSDSLSGDSWAERARWASTMSPWEQPEQQQCASHAKKKKSLETYRGDKHAPWIIMYNELFIPWIKMQEHDAHSVQTYHSYIINPEWIWLVDLNSQFTNNLAYMHRFRFQIFLIWNKIWISVFFEHAGETQTSSFNTHF